MEYTNPANPHATLCVRNRTWSLHKDARGSLAVRSVVLRVLSVEGSAPLFPSPSSHHRCLLAIDPLLRHVTLFYHAFYPMM